jgi:hypothetical protein
VLLAGLMLSGCEWSGKHPGMAGRPTSPSLANNGRPTGTGQGWNNGRTDYTPPSFPSDPKVASNGNPALNANGSNTTGGFNSPSKYTATGGPTTTNRTTAPYANEADPRKAADPGIQQVGGTGSSFKQPSYPNTGGYPRSAAPSASPPAGPEDPQFEATPPPVLSGPKTQDYRP